MVRIALLVTFAAAALAGGAILAFDAGDTAALPRTVEPQERTAALRAAAAPARAGEPKAKRRGRTVKVVDSQFGRILADGSGQAVYIFDRERSKRSRCYGDCARAWPPVLTKAAPRAGSGARSGLLGTTRRRDGRRQVTYRGRPLYSYVDDAPGRVLCHNVDEFGGLWLVIRHDGKRVG